LINDWRRRIAPPPISPCAESGVVDPRVRAPPPPRRAA
jgi:hypothetical protein